MKKYPPTAITMKSLPKPTGPYLVGIQKYDLFDEYRQDVSYPKGRLIPIQIYFPTKKGQHKLHPKIFEKHAPQVFSQIFYHVYSSMVDISNLNDKKHPLVFLNHGLTAAMTDYAIIAEDLASNGYIVVTIQHQLNTDLVEEPKSWRTHSFSLQARFVDNILHVFEWIKLNKLEIFCDRINSSKVSFIGHSLGSNAVLLLANRVGGLLKGQPRRRLLPHEDDEKNIKECIIVFDFDTSFVYPNHNDYPTLYLFSGERKNQLKDSGIFTDLIDLGHSVKYYTPSKHITFLDQGYIDPRDPCIPKLYYFDGTSEEQKVFFNKLRIDILEFLEKNNM